MKRRSRLLIAAIGSLLLSFLSLVLTAQDTTSEPTWSNGRHDDSTKEFRKVRTDGNVVSDEKYFVGSSNPATDWPSAHPGPEDGWANSQPHRFQVYFQLINVPETGTSVLVLDTAGVHADSPSMVEITLNGRSLTRDVLPAGTLDAPRHRDHPSTEERRLRIEVPNTLLKQSVNQLVLSTEQGSWFQYDAISFINPHVR